MRVATLVVFSAVGLGGGAAMAADVPAVSSIDAVVVFPSGAEVLRVAKVKVAAGDQRIILPDLPASVMPGSIRVEGKSTGKLAIGSVDSRTMFVPSTDAVASESERKRLEDQVDALRDTRAVFEAQVQAAEMQKKLIANLAELPKVPPGAQEAGPPVDWRMVLGTIASGSADAKKAEVEARAKMRETDRSIADVKGKLAALAPAREQRTEVTVNVVAGGDLDAELSVRYQVPFASWAALYDARLATGSKAQAPKLELTRRAAIKQNSGEAWTNVALSLSTTRPTVGASAPELGTISVDYVPDAPPPAPAPAAAPAPLAKMKSMQRRETADDELAVRGAADAPMVAAEAVDADVVQAPFQAIYGVPGRVTVPTTGEIKRVQLMQESIEPALVVRTVPRLDAKGYLYAKMVLPKSSAVLPGEVALFRDETFVGTGRLPLIGPGEAHELGFGSDDAIRVKYAVTEDKRGEKGLISSSKTDTRGYKITVRNLHERAIAVTVADNIPVSQQQDIKVTLTGRSPPTKMDVDDKRGVVAWDMTLDPDQEQAVEFGYQVVWPGAKAITYWP